MEKLTSCLSCCPCNGGTETAPRQKSESELAVSELMTKLNQQASFSGATATSWTALPQAKTSQSASVVVFRNQEGSVRHHKITIGNKTQDLPWKSQVTPGVHTAPDVFSVFEDVVLVYPKGQYGMAAYSLNDGQLIGKLEGQAPAVNTDESIRRVELGSAGKDYVVRVSVSSPNGLRFLYSQS